MKPGDTPLLTVDLPGTAGGMVELTDFYVEEIPAYLPCGEGEHCMALIEKQGLTTPAAISRICDQLGKKPKEAGYAGLKDKNGVTRQWISVQGARPADVMQIQQPELRVLEAALHHNKLRTGHLRGNRFRVMLRGTVPEAQERARRVLARLEGEGLPNYFGEQRFGRQGDNAEKGLRLIKGALSVRDRFLRRLLVSALQALLYNEVLAERVRQGTLRQLLGGEVLQRVGRGGPFVSPPEEAEETARRLSAGELVLTGPLCGPRMPMPAPESPALALEQRVFDHFGVTPAHFARLGRIARGGRRPLTAVVEDATVREAPGGDGLLIHFVLPPGSYATVLLREIVKGEVHRGVA